MRPVNFDAAGGIVPRKENITEKKYFYKDITKKLSYLFSFPSENIFLNNNETSLFCEILKTLDKKYTLVTSDHDCWSFFKIMQGKSVRQYVTRPSKDNYGVVPINKKNYASNIKIIKWTNKQKFISDLLASIPDSETIVFLSHVSKVTGQIFPVKEIYKKISKLNKKRKNRILFIVDGAHSVFTFKIKPLRVSDIYFGTSSKALGAKPCVAFCFINPKLNLKLRNNVYSKKAIDSFGFCLDSFIKKGKYSLCKKNKKIIERKLKEIKFPLKNISQSPYMFCFESEQAKDIVKILKDEGVEVSLSSDAKWTNYKGRPIFRISFRDDTTKEEIDLLIQKLSFIQKLIKLQDVTILKKIKEKGVLFVDADKIGGTIYSKINRKPLAISLLQTICKENKKPSTYWSYDDFKKNIKKINDYGILGVTSTSLGHHRIIEDLKKINLDNVLVIKGGCHERVCGRNLQLQKDYPVDISFLEGSDSFDLFLKLINKRNKSIYKIYKGLKKIPNLSIRGVNTKIMQEKVKLISPEFIDPEEPFDVFDSRFPMFRIYTTFGCPFRCIFCAIQKNSSRLSPQDTVKQIKSLMDYYKVKEANIFFEDGTFTYDRKWIDRFCEILEKSKLRLHLGIQTRIDCLDEDMIKKLKRVGLYYVFLGIESFDRTQIERINKGQTDTQRLFIMLDRLLKKYNIKRGVSIIYFPPEKTAFYNTLKALVPENIDKIVMETSKVYPGTGLSRLVGEEEVQEKYNKGIVCKSQNREDNNALLVNTENKIVKRANLDYKKIKKLLGKNYIEVEKGNYNLIYRK